MIRFFCVVLLCSIGLSSYASTALQYTFQTPQQQQQFQQLVEELRCLVCQNQNLAESNAPLANDLRQEVYQMTVQGQSKQQVIDFLVQRYGDFVLYRPPFQLNTYLLWLAPLLFLIVAALITYSMLRRAKPATALTAEQRQVIQKSLEDLKKSKVAENDR